MKDAYIIVTALLFGFNAFQTANETMRAHAKGLTAITRSYSLRTSSIAAWVALVFCVWAVMVVG